MKSYSYSKKKTFIIYKDSAYHIVLEDNFIHDPEYEKCFKMSIDSIYDTDQYFFCFYFIIEQLLKKKKKQLCIYFALFVFGILWGTVLLFRQVFESFSRRLMAMALVHLCILKSALKFIHLFCSSTNKWNNYLFYEETINYLHDSLETAVDFDTLYMLLQYLSVLPLCWDLWTLWTWFAWEERGLQTETHVQYQSQYQHYYSRVNVSEVCLQCLVLADVGVHYMSTFYQDEYLHEVVDREIEQCRRKAEVINKFRFNWIMQVNSYITARQVHFCGSQCLLCGLDDTLYMVKLDCKHSFHVLCLKNLYYNHISVYCPKCNINYIDSANFLV